MIERKELKREARAAMGATRPSAVWVTLMVMAALLIVQVLSLSLNGDIDAYRAMYESVLEGRPQYVVPTGTNSAIGWILALALDIMSMVLSVGYTLYILRLSRRQNPSFGDVFDAFGVFFRAIWITILRSLLISLWSFAYALPATMLGLVIDPIAAALLCLPLLIPMFMAAYSYRLAVYIMLDEPEYSCIQCLALSRMAMRGRRWELFLLDLSFLGWYLLSIIPFVALWVEPYTSTTGALWYERIMPAFKEGLERDLAARNGGGWNSAAGGGYHVPGETWAGDEEDEGVEDDDGVEDDEDPIE